MYSIECKHVVVSTHYKNASTFIMRLMNVCVRCVCELKRRVRTHKYKQIVCVDVWCWWSEYNKNDVESACGKCMAGTRRWLFINRKCTFWNVLHFTRMIMFLAKIALNPFSFSLIVARFNEWWSYYLQTCWSLPPSNVVYHVVLNISMSLTLNMIFVSNLL